MKNQTKLQLDMHMIKLRLALMTMKQTEVKSMPLRPVEAYSR